VTLGAPAIAKELGFLVLSFTRKICDTGRTVSVEKREYLLNDVFELKTACDLTSDLHSAGKSIPEIQLALQDRFGRYFSEKNVEILLEGTSH
jgi:hypothetical protein